MSCMGEDNRKMKKIGESFKRMDEHTKDFQVLATIKGPLGVLTQSSSARNYVED